ncbi:MAG: pyridoxine 5'-phosphate synthase [Lysobacteraceae bacterium]
MTPPTTLLSINLNKIAVLRNSRGGERPDLRSAAETVISAGCGGLTVHPRPDQRHIRPDDVRMLADLCRDRVEFNIEGNPFAPARADYPGLLALVEQTRPTQVTLVPDGDGQLTSDHGFDLARDGLRLAPLVKTFTSLGCRVSLFMDCGAARLEDAAAMGATRIELYTGPYAEAHARGDAKSALASCFETAQRAHAVGLDVNAGHDLDQANLATLLRAVPRVREVSIGHALIGEALYAGLHDTVSAYLRIIASAHAST